MTIHIPRAALTLRQLALALLILLPLSALGSRWGLWPYTAGLFLLVIAMAGSLLLQVITMIWLMRKPIAPTKSALRWASLFALPPLVLAASLMRGDVNRAPLHNISTDLANPPQFTVAQSQRGENSNSLEYTDEVAGLQQLHYPDISPILSKLPPLEAFQHSLNLANQMGWKVYHNNPATDHIEAVDTTFWFGFKDDIVIRIQQHSQGSRIDLRSVSRVGLSDLGANAQRIRDFKQAFNQ